MSRTATRDRERSDHIFRRPGIQCPLFADRGKLFADFRAGARLPSCRLLSCQTPCFQGVSSLARSVAGHDGLAGLIGALAFDHAEHLSGELVHGRAGGLLWGQRSAVAFGLRRLPSGGGLFDVQVMAHRRQCGHVGQAAQQGVALLVDAGAAGGRSGLVAARAGADEGAHLAGVVEALEVDGADGRGA